MISEEIYRTTVDKILKQANENLDPDISMAQKQIAKENIKRAKETEDSVLTFITEYNNELIKFSVLKLKLITDDEIDDEDYYFPDDEYEDEEELGVSMTFLINYSLELILIKKGEFYLEEYLKKLRMPNSKKYAKELRYIYSQIKVGFQS